jgi:predicted dienelactone hydrolase
MTFTRMVADRFVGPAMIIMLLASCTFDPTSKTEPAATLPQQTTIAPTATQRLTSYPLSKPGHYHIGIQRNFVFQDASRGGREVTITIWYPAAMSQDSSSTHPTSDAVVNPTGAPYPLILTSLKGASIVGPHLASHGFFVVGINGLDSYTPWDNNLIDQPFDILFALDQIGENPPEGLEGMIDSQHAGAMGYSFDGYNALALSGARVDPEFYLTECTRRPFRHHYCSMSSDWDQFSTYAGEAITTSDDGLWQPMTDDRIRAVMPMAPEGVSLFGPRGLSAVDRPTLIIGATDDVICDYTREAVYMLEHIGTAERRLISFVGQDHMMIYNPEIVSRMEHFAVAFFGYYLQGRKNYSSYFSKDFVEQQDNLVWGVYQGE